MALGRMRKGTGSFVPPKLQITSMMDMFTIILIFLLFSFSSKPEVTGLDKNMKLPNSSSEMDHMECIKLVLSTEHLKIGDKVIADVKDGEVLGLNSKDLKGSDVFRELEAYSKQKRAEKKDATEGNEPEPLLFFCDKRLPFKTINNITKTAAMAGFPNFQFAVLKK